MGKILVKNVIKRKKGFLYYIDGAGNVCEAKMARGGKRKKKKAVKKKVVKRKPAKRSAAKKKPVRKKATKKRR